MYSKIFNDSKFFLKFFIISLAVYGQALYFDFFIFDDFSLVASNPLVRDVTLKDFLTPWSTSNTPLITNFWQVISFFFGAESPAAFRLINILIHSFNALLVMFFLRRMFTLYLPVEKKDLKLDSFVMVGVLVFVFHPAQVESVVWVSSLKEILAASFGLLSILSYMKAEEEDQPKYQLLSYVFLGLGVLTHPTISALCLMFLWFDFTFYKKSIRDAIFKNGFYIAIILAALLLHKLLNPQIPLGQGEPLYLRMMMMLDSIRVYFLKLFVPGYYSFDYMRNYQNVSQELKSQSLPKVFTFLTALFLWGGVTLSKSNRFKFIYYSLAPIVILLIVNLGIVAYSFQNISTVADRYLYFPMIGLSLFASYLSVVIAKGKLEEKVKKIVLTSLSLYLLVFFSQTLIRIPKWKNSEVLLRSSIKSSEKVSYALALSLATKLRAAGKIRESIFWYESARRVVKEKLTIAKEDEALSALFEIYSESKNKSEGEILLAEYKASEKVPRAQLATAISKYLIEFGNLEDADRLVSFSNEVYGESETLKMMKLKIGFLKLEKLRDSLKVLGEFYLKDKQFDKAQDYLGKYRDLLIVEKKDLSKIDKILKSIEEGPKK